jgi:5-methylcytosine-specific restriction endonuclease McrA
MFMLWKGTKKGRFIGNWSYFTGSHGWENVPSNLQTLCKQCNGLKGVNEIEYRSVVSPLSKPK